MPTPITPISPISPSGPSNPMSPSGPSSPVSSSNPSGFSSLPFGEGRGEALPPSPLGRAGERLYLPSLRGGPGWGFSSLLLLLLLSLLSSCRHPAAPSADAGGTIQTAAAVWSSFPFQHLDSVTAPTFVRPFALFAQRLHDAAADTAATAAAVDALMARATVTRPSLDVVAQCAAELWHDPNGALRDDHLYRRVLMAQLASGHYDAVESQTLAYQLDLVSRNRVGTPAADILFATADGRQLRLYDIQAPYVLLFFYNPGCTLCAEVKAQLMGSQRLAALVAQRRLVLVALYPDEDLAAWHDDLPTLPPTWIVAHDPTQQVLNENLYNLEAIPSLYLLDSRKHVLVKDAASIEEIEAQLTIDN